MMAGVLSGCGDGGPADPATPVDGLPAAGHPEARCAVPAQAAAVDTSAPDRVVGDGTAESCTAQAFRDAVALGGVITFDCGPEPVRITMDAPARVFNDASDEVVIDGGGLVTLSGGGSSRVLYMNTCDPALVWTTSHCQDQDHPRLVLQNLTFVDGAVGGDTPVEGAYGGGAVFVRGGRVRVVNSRFFANTCDPVGPDVGGGALRVLSQHDGQPVYIVNSTFGGPQQDGQADVGNVCSNGSALSSIGVSWTILNSVFEGNRAIGYGANPARELTPGGGSGGAMYFDGNTFHVEVCGSRVVGNHAREGGGAIFFVSNDRSGTLTIRDSELRENPSEGFETRGLPGIFVLQDGETTVVDSVIE